MGLLIRRDARNGGDRLRFVTAFVTAGVFGGAWRGLNDWSRSPDLNRGPTDYESPAGTGPLWRRLESKRLRLVSKHPDAYPAVVEGHFVTDS